MCYFMADDIMERVYARDRGHMTRQEAKEGYRTNAYIFVTTHLCRGENDLSRFQGQSPQCPDLLPYDPTSYMSHYLSRGHSKDCVSRT